MKTILLILWLICFCPQLYSQQLIMSINVQNMHLWRKDKWRVDAGIGGAFALNRAGDSSHFYGDTPAIVHAALKITRNLNIGKWEIPIFTCALWNPQCNQAFFQLGTQLYLF